MNPGELLNTINGLPAHPLLVHAVVVLIPLSAIGAVLISVVPAWRRRYWLPVLALTVVAVAAVPLAKEAGERLFARLGSPNDPVLRRHTELGDHLLPYALVFAALLILLLVFGRLADRAWVAAVEMAQQEPDIIDIAPSPPRLWRVITVLVSLLLIASAAVVTYQVYLTGDSGSSSVWSDVGRG
ncbi:MAG: hypothetical protein JOZ47_11160 [Kutzneria sp.]|nr:hypothetical protein [Kutzneria sp.]MBV9845620.1 hypothetical protein [Kutzneria sp.]